MREAYRLHKSDFIAILAEKNIYLHLAFSYVAHIEYDSKTIHSKMPAILNKIVNKFNKMGL